MEAEKGRIKDVDVESDGSVGAGQEEGKGDEEDYRDAAGEGGKKKYRVRREGGEKGGSNVQ